MRSRVWLWIINDKICQIYFSNQETAPYSPTFEAKLQAILCKANTPGTNWLSPRERSGRITGKMVTEFVNLEDNVMSASMRRPPYKSVRLARVVSISNTVFPSVLVYIFRIFRYPDLIIR